MLNPIPTTRRTLAMAIDDTCTRLEECPTAPEHARKQPLTGGYIMIVGQERWRCDASGEIREYTERKNSDELVAGKSPFKSVWWKE